MHTPPGRSTRRRSAAAYAVVAHSCTGHDYGGRALRRRLESSRRGGHFAYRRTYTCAIGMPSAMADVHSCGGKREVAVGEASAARSQHSTQVDCGLRSYGPYSHGVYSYGLYSYGLYSYGPYGCAYTGMAYIVLAYIGMAYIVMDYTVMAYIGAAYIAMAYTAIGNYTGRSTR